MKVSSHPLISVVVPVYRVERFLPQCIDSILSGGIDDYELILVDDGSPDNSGQIADDYAARYPKHIQVIHQKNRGQTLARQAGFKASRGDYIWLVDSDDFITKNSLKLLSEVIRQEKPDIINFDCIFETNGQSIKKRQATPSGIFDSTALREKVFPTLIYSGRFFYFGINGAMHEKVFRRQILAPNLLGVNPHIKIHEDGLTTYGCYLDARKVVHLPEAFLYHVRRDYQNSLTQSYQPDSWPSFSAFYDSAQALATRFRPTFDLTNQVNYWLLYELFCILRGEFLFKSEKSFRAKVQLFRSIRTDKKVQKLLADVDLTNISGDNGRLLRAFSKRRIAASVGLAMKIASQLHAKRLAKKILRR